LELILGLLKSLKIRTLGSP
jgi:hypothetical protein